MTSRTSSVARWLVANAAFSAGSGLLMIATSWLLPEVIGVGGSGVYVALGIGLVAYSAWLWRLARHGVDRPNGIAVVVGDVVWVAGSVILAGSGATTPAGALLVVAVALVIAVFAAGQWRALNR